MLHVCRLADNEAGPSNYGWNRVVFLVLFGASEVNRSIHTGRQLTSFILCQLPFLPQAPQFILA